MPAKPKLGQNFLHDASAIRRIVAALGDIADETVVEIGPGNGAITGVLAHNAARLIAIELDRELAVRLRALVGRNAFPSWSRTYCSSTLRRRRRKQAGNWW